MISDAPNFAARIVKCFYVDRSITFVAPDTKHNDYKCFQRYFKFIDYEHEQYYVSFVDNSQISFPKEVAHIYIKLLYFFVIKNYLDVFQVLNLLSEGNCSITDYSDVDDMSVWDLVFNLENYFIVIIKSNTDDVDMLKMAYKIAIILVKVDPREN